MSQQSSPWARPDTEVVLVGGPPAEQNPAAGRSVPPATRPGGAVRPGGAPSGGHGGASLPGDRAVAGQAGGPPAGSAVHTGQRLGPGSPTGQRLGSGSPGGGYRPGAVTRLGTARPQPAPAGPTPPIDPIEQLKARDRRLRRIFLAVAAGVLAVGLVVVLAIVMTGNTSPSGIFGRPLAGPADTRPELAKRCPPPTDAPDSGPLQVPPAPPGPRTVDPEAGISYAAYSEPWLPWDQVWKGGTLEVTYRVGQHFITEPGPLFTGYHASILSGSVPATVNDALVLDLECTGRQVAADVRAEYYFQPNTQEMVRDERTTLGGRPAWVTVFRLHFDQAGLRAKDELVGVVLIDVGRPEAAILYVSIPGTHRQWDHVLDEVIDSVRPV